MSNTYKSPAVILNEPSNWEEWIFTVKIRAQPLDTWQYLDLDRTVSLGVPANLAPLPLQAKEGATLLDLPSAELIRLKTLTELSR